MDSISSSTAIANTQASAQASQAVAPSTGDEFNTFIQLLTAQIRNQDPLEPLDSTQFVEQLATFSTLEQQVRSNSALESIAVMIGDLHAMAATDWLGQTVTVQSSWVPFEGEPVAFEADLPEGIDRALLTVRDANGAVIFSEALDTTAERHTWSGELSDGSYAAAGSINQISIDIYNGGEFSGSLAPRLVTEVTDVATEDGKLRLGTKLNLSAGIDDIRMAHK